jgi:hypothetical protein
VGLLVVGLVYLFHALSPPNMGSEARRLLSYALRNQPERMFQFSAVHEQAMTGLTVESWVQVWHKLIYPRLAKYKPVGSVKSSGDERSGSASVEMVGENGHRVVFVMDCHRSPEGAKTTLLSLVEEMWLWEYGSKHRLREFSAEHFWRAGLEGIRADRVVLEELGIRGFASLDPTEPLVTFDAIEKSCESRLRALQEGKG